MRVLLIITGLSASGLVAALLLPGWSDLVLLFGPCLIAGLLLLLRKGAKSEQPEHKESSSKSLDPTKKWAVIDGSNVMHWEDGVPSLDPVKQAIQVLAKHGLTAGVMFDANAGYKLFGEYRHDGVFARKLGLPEDHIMVVPKGSPADPYILTAARDLHARIVTNDQFRDWARYYPEIRKRGHLIKGKSKNGKVQLDLSQ